MPSAATTRSASRKRDRIVDVRLEIDSVDIELPRAVLKDAQELDPAAAAEAVAAAAYDRASPCQRKSMSSQ